MRIGTIFLYASLLLALNTPNSFAQDTKPKAGTGVSDEVAPETTTVTIPKPNDLDAYFGSWIFADGNAFGPLDKFPNFGKMPMPVEASPNNLYIIHITDWVDTAAGKAAAKINFVSSNWYVYRYDGKSFKNVIRAGKDLPPIYGQKFGVLLSVSRIQRAKGRNTAAPQITYTVTTTERTPDNVLALQALIGAVTGITIGGGEQTPGPKAMAVSPNDYDFRIEEFSTNSKALNAPFDLAFKATAKSVVKGTDGTCHDLKATSTCEFDRTITVDARAYWNAGVAVPVRGPVEYQYDLAKDNSVEQTHTRHSAILATFDFSPWARTCPMTKCPYLQVGVPLSGAAFHAPYFGAAQPIPFSKKWLQISVFGGFMLMRQTSPTTLKIGDITTAAAFNSDLHTNWPVKAIYGIEVPVTSIVKSIKSSIK
jgi:hypothetical protein